MKDKKIHTPMMEQYLAIKEQHKDYLLFYRMGDFYEMFFDDAVNAAAALDIALTKRGKENGQNIPMCGVPVASHDIYLSRLIKKGFKIAVCDQLENPAEAKKRGNASCVKRDVVRIITPGTITEETILDSKHNNYLLCIAEDAHYNFGLAWVDMSTGEFGTELVLQPALAAACSRLEPKEIIICENKVSDTDFIACLNIDPQRITPLAGTKYSFASAKQNLEEFFNVKTLEALGDFSKAEITAAGVLSDYLLLTQKGKMPKLEKPVRVKDGQFMEIDASTRKSLELFGKMNESKGATLFSVLDNTMTGAGARLLASRLVAPLVNPMAINRRLDVVDFFVSCFEVRDKVRELLSACGDIERSLSRVSVSRAAPRDLANIRDVLARIPKISAALFLSGDFLPQPLQDIVKNLGNHSETEDVLTRALAADLPVFARDGGFIAKGFSAELDNLRELSDNSRHLIAKLQLKYAEESKIPTLKICHNNIIGYYIEVTAKYAQDMIDAARGGSTPFIHRQTMANAARFTTLELNGLEEKIMSAAGKATALELQIFEELCALIMQDSESILNASKALAELDVASSLAFLAEKRNYCRPKVDDSNAFAIVKGRHPVVEAAYQGKRGADFIANDCVMSQDGKEGSLWLITGPNMAGKSTFLRQNALIAIMAQAGMFVPAENAHIGVIDKLFSRVGAADDLARGQSTFMVEMVETAAILNQATERSFVILDEIGRGTSTFDGLSIAWAVLESLHEDKKCRGLFATHYHELTVLDETLPHLAVYTMKTKEWNDDIVFMYEIIKGKADRSYGIHVAKLAGLPDKVIERASQVLAGLEAKKIKVQQMLGDLPLFAELEKSTENKKTENPCESRLRSLILKINPDEMTPREAMNEIYKLIKAVDDEQS